MCLEKNIVYGLIVVLAVWVFALKCVPLRRGLCGFMSEAFHARAAGSSKYSVGA